MSAWPAPPLEPETERRLVEIGGADLVVGIPSFRNAATIAHVAAAAHEGLSRHFPRSPRGAGRLRRRLRGRHARGVRRGARARPPVTGPSRSTRLVIRYRGPSGKGSAFRTIFHVAARLGAQACAVVDADLRSVTPGLVRAPAATR